MLKNTELLENTRYQQLQASNPKFSCWVFASAGSGKTKVLVDRVIRLLLEGVEANKILCLTFTKNAAGEMHSRINEILAEYAIKSDEDLKKEIFELTNSKISNSDLIRARNLFATIIEDNSKINIQTIHGFCQSLLSIFPFETSISPNFEIIDSVIEKKMLDSSIENVLKFSNFDSKLRSIIFELSSIFSQKEFLQITKKVLEQREEIDLLKNNFCGIDNFKRGLYKNLGIEYNESFDSINSEFIERINYNDLKKIVEALENSKNKTDKNFVEIINNFLENGDNLEFISKLKSTFYTSKNQLRKKIVTDNFIKLVDSEISNLQGEFSKYLVKINSFKIALHSSFIIEFADAIILDYKKLKEKNNFLDYSDLIYKANQLLANGQYRDWVLLKMDGFFDHIMVDESQDTNDSQWQIIKALTDDFFSGNTLRNYNRTIFIIGDDKQSIFGFQGSKPNISREVYNYFSKKIGYDKLLKIDFKYSHRSLQNILDLVDSTFLNTNNLLQENYQKHLSSRLGDGIIELWPIISKKKDLNNDIKEMNLHRFDRNIEDSEAFFVSKIIVNKIKDLLNSKRILESTGKEIRAQDIMILFRRRTDKVYKIIQDLLKKSNISYKALQKINFNKNLIIQDLMALAKFSILQSDDLNLACLLKSPFFLVSEDKLYKLAMDKNKKQLSLYEAILSDEENNQDLIQSLKLVIDRSQNLNSYNFFRSYISDEIIASYIEECGEIAEDIIDKFLLKIFELSKQQLFNIQKLVNFIESSSIEIELQNFSSNSITMATIHAAKGMQSPIVIMPDCCFSFLKLPSNKDNFIWYDFVDKTNKNNSLLPFYIADKSAAEFLPKNPFVDRNHDLKSEYFRLLYVAMTRAQDQLYITGYGQDNDSDSWYEIIRNGFNNLKNVREINFCNYVSSLSEGQFLEKKLAMFDFQHTILRIGGNSYE